MGIWDGTVEYIDLDNCSNGGLYKLKCMHFQLGVFNADESCFVGIRDKLNGSYLFPAYHVDYDTLIGLCLPIELLEMCPLDNFGFIRNAALAEYLIEAEIRYSHRLH